MRCNLDLLGSCSLKLIGFIFSNILYGPNFLNFSLVLGRFVLMCLRSRYTLFPLFSGGPILRFWLLYFAVFRFKKSISLNNYFCNFLSLFASTTDCYVLG